MKIVIKWCLFGLSLLLFSTQLQGVSWNVVEASLKPELESFIPSSSLNMSNLSATESSMFIDEFSVLWGWGQNRYGQLGDGTTTDRLTPIRIMEDVVGVSAGYRHTMAIKTDGSLWAWGNNIYGQLGDGTKTLQLSPIKIMDNVTHVSVGSEHTLVIKTDGSLWAFGRNDSGQLGDGTAINQLSPVKIMDNVTNISAGFGHSLAIKTDGSLWAWGQNSSGQLGDSTQINQFSPIVILENISHVSAGYWHTSVIKTDGSLWAWGQNASGQLGDGTRTPSSSPIKIMENSVNVSAGSEHTLTIKEDGSLWAFGRNDYGQLGDGTTINQLSPVKIMDNVTNISAGFWHSLAIKADDSLMVWGRNEFGQLGIGVKSSQSKPINVFESVFDISSGHWHSFTIKNDNSLWAWGKNDYGQLGEVTRVAQSSLFKTLDNVLSISAGGEHTLAIKEDGSLWAWGRNSYGQLGDGTTTEQSLPVKIMDDVAHVSAGEKHSLAIKEDGTLWAWGVGALGDGTRNAQSSPIKIMDNVINVTAGSEHTLAIKEDGSLWAWGNNDYGQLGIGERTDVLSPIKIMDNVLFVSANNKQSMAIQTDGSLWAWGQNGFSQLGDGTQIDRLSPVKIMEHVTSVSTGYWHTLAIKTDGSLWAWGNNNYNQLGDGSSTNQILPLKIMENVERVSAGYWHTLVIKKDGRLWTWGNNDFGQLGNGVKGYSELAIHNTHFDSTPPIITVNEFIKTPINQNITVKVNVNEGTLNQESYTFTENGSFTFFAIDEARNVTEETVVITNIDKSLPIIEGVEAFGVYNTIRTITFNDGVATLNGVIIESGFEVSQEGSYSLRIIDDTEREVLLTFIIDKTAPVITVEDYILSPTNQDIIVSVTTDKGVLNQSIYTFTENGSYTFIATDEAGNFTVETITITNIDKVPPIITISEYTKTPTNQSITVSASTNKGVLNQESYTFTENGSMIFIAIDEAGNVTEKKVRMTNIDKIPPVITVGNYITTLTNQDITVSVTTNEGTLNQSSYTFTENGSFTFIATDEAGNISEETVTISNIDKIAPIITVREYTTEPTNQDITVSVTTNEGTLNQESFTFTENGSFIFIATDEAGNSTEEIITISNIDKMLPKVDGIEDFKTYNTNRIIVFDKGIATLNGEVIESGIEVIQEGNYELVVIDNAGNSVTIRFVIDKTPPIITVGEYTTTPTDQNITVTVTTNEGTLNQTSYTFTENGSFTFIATDEAGNITEMIVTITNIIHNVEIYKSIIGKGGNIELYVSNALITTNKVPIGSNLDIRLIVESGFRLYELKVNGSVLSVTNNTFTLTTTNEPLTIQAQFLKVGDLNSDGTVSIADLINLRRYLAGLQSLENESIVAADIDGNSSVSIADLVRLRRQLAGLE